MKPDPRDTCDCRVCNSDLAFIVPCMKSDDWKQPLVTTSASEPKKLAA